MPSPVCKCFSFSYHKGVMSICLCPSVDGDFVMSNDLTPEVATEGGRFGAGALLPRC